MTTEPPAASINPAPKEKAIIPMTTASLIPLTDLPMSLQMFFDPATFERMKDVARFMSQATGFLPAYLIGNPAACFAVLQRSLAWRLDPFAVAQSTYAIVSRQKINNEWSDIPQKIGYEGKLCQAIIENSGRLDPEFGGVKYAHFGPWEKVERRFKIVIEQEENRKPKRVPTQLWEDDDENGIGVKVTVKLKDESTPRELEFYMMEAQPRNSTQWITAPRRQICYAAVRAFGNTVVPHLFMGVPFDREDFDDWSSRMKDVTPPPLRSMPPLSVDMPTVPKAEPAEPEKPFIVEDVEGTLHEFSDPVEATEFLRGEFERGRLLSGKPGITEMLEKSKALFETLLKEGFQNLVDACGRTYEIELAKAEGSTPNTEADSATETAVGEHHKEQTKWGAAGKVQAIEADMRESAALRHTQEKAIPLPTKQQPKPANDENVTAAEKMIEDPPEDDVPGTEDPLTAELQKRLTEKTQAEFRQQNGKKFDVLIPIGALSPKGWFQKAKEKLTDMLDGDRPAEDFDRFLLENADGIAMLDRELLAWRRNYIDPLIKSGLARKPAEK